jgi:hypothetical protein
MASSQKLHIRLKPNCTWIGRFGFNCPSGFREEAFWNIFPLGSNVILSTAVATILNFISEQKNLKFVEDHPMNTHVQSGFNHICSFWGLPPQVIVLTQDHMEKIQKYALFWSYRITLIEPKLCINHWKVLYKLCVFYVDRNSKMTTTAGHQWSFLASFNCPSGFREEAFWNIFPIGSYVKLSPAVAAILNFIHHRNT